MKVSETPACPACGDIMRGNAQEWCACETCGLEGPRNVILRLHEVARLEDEVTRLREVEQAYLARPSGKVHLSHEDLRALQKVAADMLVGQLRRLETKWRELSNSGWSEAGGVALCADDLSAVLDELEAP